VFEQLIARSTLIFVSRIEVYIEKAEKFIGMDEPDAALNSLRKAVEAICTSVIQKENFPSNARKPTLDEKLAIISNKINSKEFNMPRHLSLEMMHVQKIGNHASHDQGDEIPISNASAQAALIQMKEIKSWYFSHYEINPKKTSKQKVAPVRKKTSPDGFIKELSKVDRNESIKLTEVFESIENLGLRLQSGTSKMGSIRIRSPRMIDFFDTENKFLFNRRFNFGVFYADGNFKNFSCEGLLGKQYLRELSKLIPDSKVFEHSTTEFRNCVVKTNGDFLKIKDILKIKDDWLALLEKFIGCIDS
jgi:hypothetical protein